MTMFNHQIVTGAPLSAPCFSEAIVGGSARNLTQYLARQVQAALVQHPQIYVQHIEVKFSDDSISDFLLDLDRLQRFQQDLNTQIGQGLAAKDFECEAGLRCEWFMTRSHLGRLSFHLLTFLAQKAFCLLGDERESSGSTLNRLIAAIWAAVQEFSAQHDDHGSGIKPRGGFYLSDRADDSGVAVLIESMRNVVECGCVGT